MRIALIAHLSDFPGPYSSSRRVEMLAQGLVERGHPVSVVIPRKLTDGSMEIHYKGIEVCWQYAGKGVNLQKARLMSRWRTWLWVMGMLRQNCLDWIWLYNLGLEGLPIALSARFSRCKIATVCGDVRFHPAHPIFEDRVRLAWIELADSLLPKLSQLNIVDTHFLERRAQRFAPRVPTLVIPSLVDPNVFHHEDNVAQVYRMQWGLEGFTVIGYFGSFFVINGVSNLFHAVRKLLDDGKKVKLLIAGKTSDGLDCDDIPTLIKKLSLEDFVIFPGLLDSEEVIKAMSVCDILTIPRIAHLSNEAGFPTKLAEYLSMGKAIVTASVGDIPSYITDGVNGMLVEAGSIDALVKALEVLIDDTDIRSKLAANARKTACEVFDYRRAAAIIETSLQSIR